MPTSSEPKKRKQKRLHFDGSWVRWGQKREQEVRRSSQEWQLFRALLRGEPVDLLDGFMLFREWREKAQDTDYSQLFRKVASNMCRELRKQPFRIRARLDHPAGKPDSWRLSDSESQGIESNIGEAVHKGREAGEQFRAGRAAAGWSLIREAYETYPDPKSLCGALVFTDALPKDRKPYERYLRAIEQLLTEYKENLSRALYTVLSRASNRRQGITDEIAETAFVRWFTEFLLVKQVVLLISGHKFATATASTTVIEEFASLVRKCRDAWEYVAEVKGKCRMGDGAVAGLLRVAEDETATFLKQLVWCDAVDKASENVIKYYKEQRHRRIDEGAVREHREAAVMAFMADLRDDLGSPDVLYSNFDIFFGQYMDKVNTQAGPIAARDTGRGDQQKWQQYSHILEMAVDIKDARNQLWQLFALGEHQHDVAAFCGVPCPVAEDSTDRELIIMLDGTTYLRVGELVANDPRNHSIMAEQCGQYKKALEDFTFAVMLADGLGVPSSMWPFGPDAKPEESVERLRSEILRAGVRHRMVPILTAGDLSTVTKGEYRKYVLADIEKMGRDDQKWWIAHVQRDAHLYVEPLEDRYEAPPHYRRYKFTKDYPEYDSTLEERISGGLRGKCVKAVAKKYRDMAPSDCEKLVYQVLVGHVVIGWHYFRACDAIKPVKGYRDYLPSEGRASLISYSALEQLERVKTGLSSVSRFLVPYCLDRVLDEHGKGDSDNLVTTIFDFARSDVATKEIRAMVRDVRDQLERGNDHAVDKLVGQFNAKASKDDDHMVVESRVERFDEIRRAGRWAQELVKGTHSEVRQRVDSRLADLFPEVFKGPD